MKKTLLAVASFFIIGLSLSAQTTTIKETPKGNVSSTTAQNNVVPGSKLFDSSYPLRLSLFQTEVDNLFKLNTGDSFSLGSKDGITLSGTVVKIMTDAATGSKTISLKTNQLAEGTRFILSIKKNDKGINEYSGNITNKVYPDAYKVTASFNGFVLLSQMLAKQIVSE